MIETSEERLASLLSRLTEFNETPGEGITRPTFSTAYFQAQDYLRSELESIGLEVIQSRQGNLRARLAGADPQAPAVMTGSHIDSVTNGGAFDGVAGVVAAVEAVRVIASAGLELRCPVDVMIFAEEEGARFGSLLTGSKAAIGELTLDDLSQQRDSSGRSYVECLHDGGLDPRTLADDIIKATDVKAMLELHIEQSVVLEKARIPVGIVEKIAGARQIVVKIHGVANHAGATPMDARADALAASAALIGQIEAIANRLGKSGMKTVATVGRIRCEPNVANVIPGYAEFTVDIRDVEMAAIGIALELIQTAIREEVTRRGLSFTVEGVSQSPPIALSAPVADELAAVAEMLDIPYLRMHSGAVHDSAILAQITDVGMIFVPSKEGRSHCPEEYSEISAIKKGADILLHGLIRLAR